MILTGKNSVLLILVPKFIDMPSSIHSISNINKEYRCFEKIFHQVEESEWLLISTTFTATFGLFLIVLTQENALS